MKMYTPDNLNENTASVPETIESEAIETVAEKKRVSFAFAKRHQIILDTNKEDSYQIHFGPDTSLQTLNELRRYLRVPLKLQMHKTEEFNRRLQENYEQGSNEAMQMAGELGEELDLFSVAQELGEPEDLLEAADDAPIIRLINALLTEAIKEGASDIHIEPYENRLVVRLRADGVLRQVLEQKKAITSLIVSRIKVMAKLDIAEKRLPQDGRISLRIAGRSVDVRVSTMPSSHGERVVLRLLDKQAGRIDLERLGMAKVSLDAMVQMIKKPHGIILVTGPTGSGKTTSLYAVLTRLNDRQRNIMTVEDPIEYHLDGIGQTNVNAKVNMTFAKGLRAILRQDPDVVMIGEIRDLETAEIAVQASLTGHLVLSTLHTNTAVGSVTRLRDMGVEPFLLSSSLIGVVAQRLVRVLCPSCKKPAQASAADCKLLGVDSVNPPTLFTPQGCAECNHLGYRGRTGIYEVIEIDNEMREMIHDGTGEHLLEAHARQFSPGIRQDGIRRILNGETSLEEVMRVTRET
ncbi:MAG: type II secretion system ATPase GspE [Gammaproteobacteria bacterium]|nr:type II secretion system ATPase GspE [Gammaproteobacteria bacterium]